MTTDIEAPVRPTQAQLEAFGITELRQLARQQGVALTREQYSRKALAVARLLEVMAPPEPEPEPERSDPRARYGTRPQNYSGRNYPRCTCQCSPPKVVRMSWGVEESGVRCEVCSALFTYKAVASER